MPSRKRKKSLAAHQPSTGCTVKTIITPANKAESVMAATDPGTPAKKQDPSSKNAQICQNAASQHHTYPAEESQPARGDGPSPNSKQHSRQRKTKVKQGSMLDNDLSVTLQGLATSGTQVPAIEQPSTPEAFLLPAADGPSRSTDMSKSARQRQRKKNKTLEIEAEASANKSEDITTPVPASVNPVMSPGMSKSAKQRQRKKSKLMAASGEPDVSTMLETSNSELSLPRVALAFMNSESFLVQSAKTTSNFETRQKKIWEKSKIGITEAVPTSDTVGRLLEDGHSFAQLFGTMCKDIVTGQIQASPPPPNAHFVYEDFIDPIEKQFRKEYQKLHLATFDHFFVKIAIQPATNVRVRMLDTGYSEPKFFLINSEWDAFHLIPLRLFKKDKITCVEARFDERWQCMSAFLNSLVREKKPDYANVGAYWKAVQEKKAKPFRFMDLPLELRQHVYRHAMFFRGTTATPYLKSRKGSYVLAGLPGTRAAPHNDYRHALVGVSKQIQAEAMKEYYRTATFAFRDSCMLTEFRKRHKAGSVRKIFLQLGLDDHTWFLETLEKCGGEFFEGTSLSNLREVSLSIEPDLYDVQVPRAGVTSGIQQVPVQDVDSGIGDDTDMEVVQRSEKEVVLSKYTKALAHLKNCKIHML